MGKASRLRGRGGNKSGKQIFPGFPYEREFSRAELDVLLKRWERLKETLRDAVGPQGWGLGMSEDFLQQIALHQALAGVDVDETYPPDTAFIRPVRNIDGLYVDSIQWVLTKHDKPGQRDRDAKAQAKARFKALREQAFKDVSPEVREAMCELMLEGSEWAEQQLEPDSGDEPAAGIAERNDK